MRNLNAIQAVVFVLLISLLGIAFTADKPATQADFNELQKQVQSIDKDLAVLKETKAGLEKRQNEITAVQANSLAAIANQTTTVGNYITNTSIAITLLLFIGGLATYIGVTKKVAVEAGKAAKKWIDENSEALSKQIEELKEQVAKASAEIDARSSRFASDTDAATVNIAERMKAVSALIFGGSKPSLINGSSRDADRDAVNTVRAESEALKEKPEHNFTADDFFVRGLSDYSNENYQSALLAFESAIRELGEEAPAHLRAGYLLAKGFTLGKLDKPDLETAVYAAIDDRFGKYPDLLVRQEVARALNGRSFNQIMAAKKQWAEQTLRNERLANAEAGLQRARQQCDQADSTTILGNLGYAQFLLNNLDVAEVSTKECLRLGGQEVFDAQLADAKLHRVEPHDTDYEKMLSDVWKTVQAESRDNKKKL